VGGCIQGLILVISGKAKLLYINRDAKGGLARLAGEICFCFGIFSYLWDICRIE
jgi:hypothetical protein